uniref:Uncharacterized protein n=1 Tax=Rhizophora mucronata TaxID=61149 RepID=A0A2P2NK59_RHIMU
MENQNGHSHKYPNKSHMQDGVQRLCKNLLLVATRRKIFLYCRCIPVIMKEA